MAQIKVYRAKANFAFGQQVVMSGGQKSHGLGLSSEILMMELVRIRPLVFLRGKEGIVSVDKVKVPNFIA